MYACKWNSQWKVILQVTSKIIFVIIIFDYQIRPFKKRNSPLFRWSLGVVTIKHINQFDDNAAYPVTVDKTLTKTWHRKPIVCCDLNAMTEAPIYISDDTNVEANFLPDNAQWWHQVVQFSYRRKLHQGPPDLHQPVILIDPPWALKHTLTKIPLHPSLWPGGNPLESRKLNLLGVGGKKITWAYYNPSCVNSDDLNAKMLRKERMRSVRRHSNDFNIYRVSSSFLQLYKKIF